ncbi:hypothetical protein IWQ51_006829 [Labrenzia sp. EL_142]|nr:hypothetical protein [Labrenzia sp. EL_142]
MRNVLFKLLTRIRTSVAAIVSSSAVVKLKQKISGKEPTNKFGIQDHIWKTIVEEAAKPTKFDLEGEVPRPPWIVYPTLHKYSIHWRMGKGEDYRSQFVDWFSKLSSFERLEYQKMYPLPDSWSGYYDFLEKETAWRNNTKKS